MSCVLSAVDLHAGRPELLTEAFLLLFRVSENTQAAQWFLELNGVAQAGRTLRAFPDHQLIATHACRCIWRTLEAHEPPAGVCVWGIVEAVCMVADAHPQDGALMGAVCSALQALSLRATFEDDDVEDATLVLLRAIKEHSGQSTLVQHAFLALANLTHMSKVACVRLLVAPGGGSGIVLMREVRRQYPKDPQLSHNMARVLAAMAKYDEVLGELMSVQVQEDLELSEADCASDEEKKMLVQQTLSKLR
ncbi:uncharacterized protein LOC116220988 [Clupea harengus]|uniref:Uncharacterized protein LOC116220988 n=1 Tax=Clupea harengus TaxID=7950 RepID=A0A6P8FB97_CLUHA|nr:uncharacterized protein LOC116220988 [Clupea harengus]